PTKMNMASIARLIGSKPVYVARLYQAYRMVMQARREEIVDTSYLEANFGVLMRALQAQGVRDFIHVPPAIAERAELSPLKKASKGPFADFVLWVFGTPESPPLLQDSRRLTDLGRILQSDRALQYLRSVANPDFDKAYYLSGGEEEEAAKAAQVAEFALR